MYHTGKPVKEFKPLKSRYMFEYISVACMAVSAPKPVIILHLHAMDFL